MPPSIENLCPDFLAFWEQARDKPVEEQERLWHALYESPHRELLDIYFTFFASRDHLIPAMPQYEAVVPTVRTMSPAVEKLIHTIKKEEVRGTDYLY